MVNTQTKAEIIAAERMRISAIMESREAQRHPKSALRLALFSDMSLEMISDMLKDLPAESRLIEAMAVEGHTGMTGSIGGGIDATTGMDKRAARKAELAAAANSTAYAKGYKTRAQVEAAGVKLNLGV